MESLPAAGRGAGRRPVPTRTALRVVPGENGNGGSGLPPAPSCPRPRRGPCGSGGTCPPAPVRRRRARRRALGHVPAISPRRPLLRATLSPSGRWSAWRRATSTSGSEAASCTWTRRRCWAARPAGSGSCRPTRTAPRPAPPPRLECAGTVGTDVAVAGRRLRPRQRSAGARSCRLAGVALADWLAPHRDYPAVDVDDGNRHARADGLRSGGAQRPPGPPPPVWHRGHGRRTRRVARRGIEDVLPLLPPRRGAR